MASFDFDADCNISKMTRAAVRATKLHIKHSEYVRVRSARDWVWGRGIDEAKPHRGARVAVRTCLAKGAVEAQEDMPSIVCMGDAGKGPRRKPAIAPMVHHAKLSDAREADVGEVETTADEGYAGEETESPQESPACGPQDAPQDLAEPCAWPALPQGASAPPAKTWPMKA